MGCWQRIARSFMAELGSALRGWASLRLEELLVGVEYTYAMLEGGWCGVAATPYWLPRSRLAPIRLPWQGATPNTLARLALETGNPLAFSALLAAVNAATSALIASKPTPWLQGGDVAGYVAGKGARRVVMVGFMRGLAGELARRGIEVYVVEADRELAGETAALGYPVLGGVEAERALATADIVVASGSILVDPCEAEKILGLARGRLILVGPSSSFHPRIACRLGAAAVAGVYYDPRVCNSLREAVALGGGPHTAEKSYGVRLARWLARAEC